ncbi:alpha-2-macroglobulin family protein [Flammeovirgaceae bacterium SG7u.111]|nr:alpha-2-macroglobulin family protein [Flammeovirgaceae bacterium SG7u.132]WPO35406.1 alpha-2-macroglobulin family protein [Flammeovirgaceae bacterium SG7u.111]
MRKVFFYFMLLIGFSTHISAQNYPSVTLSVNKTFSEKEEVKISFNGSYYDNTSEYNLQLKLYRFSSVDEHFLSEKELNGGVLSDSIVGKLALEKTWRQELGRNGTVNVGKLSQGAYVLEAWGNGQRARLLFFVTNYNLITRKVDSELLAFVADKETGKRVEGFEYVMVSEKGRVKQDTFEKGLAYFDFSNDTLQQGYTNHPLLAVKEGKFAVSKFYFGSASNSSRPMHYIFTDRPAYRPGQMVRFKAIFRELLKNNLEVPSDSAIYEIKNSNYESVFKKKVALDEAGSFSDSIFVPKDAPLGEWLISASLISKEGRKARYVADFSFKVEEYKKPEYEVNVALDKSQYVMGETLTASIDAQYFFGAPVANAQVEYRIVREEYYVSPYRFSYYWWWYDDYYGRNTEKTVVDYGNGEINEDGSFSITVETPVDDNERNYRYSVIVEVTDASRRTISGSKSVIVANTAFNMSARSDKYFFKTDEKVSIIASASDFSGKPVETEFEAVMYYSNSFNRDQVYQRQTLKTDARGEKIVLFDAPEAGYYYVEVVATDKNGRKTKSQASFYVVSPDDNYYGWWDTGGSSVQIMTDKKVYEAGENVKAMVYVEHEADVLFAMNGPNLKQYGLYEFKGKEGNKGAFREIEIELEEGVYGQQEIMVAYAIGGKTYSRTANISVVPIQKYLNVELKFSEKEYRPGTTAEAILKVTDRDGKPVKGANVTLSTADESIYSLYPDNSGDIRKAFYGNVYAQSSLGVSAVNHSGSSSFLSPEQLIELREKGEDLSRDVFLKEKQWSRFLLKPVSDSTQSGVKGFVVDYYSGQPIKGVKVKMGKEKAHTDEHGYYEFIGFAEYDSIIHFTHKGHSTIIYELVVGKEEQVQINAAIGNRKYKELDYVRPNSDNFGVPMMAVQRTAAFSADDAWGSVDDMEFDEEASVEEVTFADSAAPMALMSARKGEGSSYKEAVVRKDFRDAIYWNPNIYTDQNGEASVNIRLPDNLTTWRTFAKVISPNTEIGQAFVKTVVTKDLLVRMEVPRFMKLGDDVVIATNIHNYLSSTKKVKVSLQAEGLTVKGTEKIIYVPANGEKRIDWNVKTQLITGAKLTVKALTNEESDAQQLEVPVQPHGLEMLVAQGAHLKDSRSETLNIYIPEAVNLASVKLNISSVPSVASALLTSLEDLIGYPYGCVEQTMSRFMPNLVVKNTLESLDGFESNIDDAELAKMTAKGLKRLAELQHSDGGWGWWTNDATHPFMTAYVVNGLYLADEVGYEIDGTMYMKGREALLKQIEKKDKDPVTFAYQVMVASQFESKEWFAKLEMPEVEKMTAYQAALWSQAAHFVGDESQATTLLEKIEKEVVQVGAIRYWGGKKFYYSWQDDRIETTATVVRALSQTNPDHELLAPAVQWLMTQRKGKSWHNTRQTAIIIYSLQNIIANELSPSLEIELLANGKKVEAYSVKKEDVFKAGKNFVLTGEKLFASKNAAITLESHPYLKHGNNKLTIKQTGSGTSYFNTQLKYFIEEEHKMLLGEVKDAEIFEVERSYFKLEAEEAKGKLMYNKKALKGEAVKSGDLVLVKVKIKSKTEKEYLLIEDPIPAGCEFVQDRTGYNIKGEEGEEEEHHHWGWSFWYTHKEYRDNRYASTVTKLKPGEYEYTYLLRAQIPGTYKVSPAVTQLMYYPEQRGFSEFFELKITE